MADNAEKQRQIEAKRDYNRRLSARNRKRIKEEIASLAAKAEMQKDRADKLEQKNTALLEQVRVLSETNHNLTERVQVLTAAVTAAAGSAGPGAASSAIGQPDLTYALGSSGAMMATGSLRGFGVNQNYLQMAGLFPGSTTPVGFIHGGGGGGLYDQLLGGWAPGVSVPPRGGGPSSAPPPPVDHLADLNQNDFLLLTRYDNSLSGSSSAPAAAPAAAAASAATTDPLAQFLAEQANTKHKHT